GERRPTVGLVLRPLPAAVVLAAARLGAPRGARRRSRPRPEVERLRARPSPRSAADVHYPQVPLPRRRPGRHPHRAADAARDVALPVLAARFAATRQLTRPVRPLKKVLATAPGHLYNSHTIAQRPARAAHRPDPVLDLPDYRQQPRMRWFRAM